MGNFVQDDGDLSHDTSSGSVTPIEVESMLNVVGIAGVANHAPMNSNSLGRALLSLPSGLPLMPPPGLSLPSGGYEDILITKAQSPPKVHASIGSAGHPHLCKEACRYTKRKGGCKNGADCPNCHLCFWQRKRETLNCVGAYSGKIDVALALDSAEDDCPSLGSVNCEGRCDKVCKYVHRKTGCRMGELCPDCHKCRWRRTLALAAPLKVGLVENSSPPQQGAQERLKVGLVENISPPQQGAQERLELLIKLQLDYATQEVSA
jgi:hypothetical protein